MPQLICLINAEGHLIHINRTIEWWGLGSVADARGKALHDILHPVCSDPECYFQRFWLSSTQARLDGRRAECEVFDPVLNRDLSLLLQPLVSCHSQARAAEDLHTVMVVDDISDIKQAKALAQRHNEALTEQVAQETERRTLSEEMQARLLTILEKTTDYVAMADASESMLYLNPAGRRMLGLGPTDDISHNKMCDHSDQEIQDYIRNVAVPAAIENGQWVGESMVRGSAGREIHTSQVIIAHRGADGQTDCFSTILRDISERVQTEQALRESQDELRQLSGLLVSIQEDERRRIALDLHDGLGQSLSLIKFAVENTAAQVAAGATDAALESLHQTIPRLREALHEVRRVSSELRPSILDDLGILPTLSWFFREFELVYGHITVEKALHISENEVPASLKITLYRVIQEATSNIVKHASADRMQISLHRADDVLHLLVKDNGNGFDPATVVFRPGKCRGLGLVSMKERVRLSGGHYRLESSLGTGTSIQAEWSLD